METVLLSDAHTKSTGYWHGEMVPELGAVIDTLWGVREVVGRRFDSRISVAPWTLSVRVPDPSLDPTP